MKQLTFSDSEDDFKHSYITRAQSSSTIGKVYFPPQLHNVLFFHGVFQNGFFSRRFENVFSSQLFFEFFFFISTGAIDSCARNNIPFICLQRRREEKKESNQYENSRTCTCEHLQLYATKIAPRTRHQLKRERDFPRIIIRALSTLTTCDHHRRLDTYNVTKSATRSIGSVRAARLYLLSASSSRRSFI